MSTPDPAAAVEEIRAQWAKVDYITFKPEVIPETGPGWQWRQELSNVLAALEAALKLPTEWRQESEALRDAAGKVWEDAPDAPGVRLKHAYAAGYAECAKALQAAITRELSGEGGRDGS